MNSCTLFAEIVQAPQLRYTQDTQLAVAEMVVQFPGLRNDDPPSTLKVVAWRNLAQEIQENYHEGDRVVIEGRLSMNRLDRPEGFKETKAELTIQRIYRLGAEGVLQMSVATPAATATATPRAPSPTTSRPSVAESVASQPPTYAVTEPDTPDDIPF